MMCSEVDVRDRTHIRVTVSHSIAVSSSGARGHERDTRGRSQTGRERACRRFLSNRSRRFTRPQRFEIRVNGLPRIWSPPSKREVHGSDPNASRGARTGRGHGRRLPTVAAQPGPSSASPTGRIRTRRPASVRSPSGVAAARSRPCTRTRPPRRVRGENGTAGRRPTARRPPRTRRRWARCLRWGAAPPGRRTTTRLVAPATTGLFHRPRSWI